METIKSHRCILATRAPKLFEYLKRTDFRWSEMDLLSAEFVLGYIYTDEIDAEKLGRMIELEKKKGDSNEEKGKEETYDFLNYKTKRTKWMLVINEIMRNAISFELNRLEKLLVNYLMDEFLSKTNVLYVLMDSLEESIKLPLVEEVCLSFIKLNVKEIIKIDEFKLLPKSVLLKIVLNL